MGTREEMSIDSILVTGASGYIGSHLNGLLQFVPLVGRVEDFDPRDKKYSNVQYVVHLADLRLDAINKDNLEENIQRHRTFISKISDLPDLKGLIFSSSCSVYGHADEMITEKSKVNPTSFYAESKLAVEEIIRSVGIKSKIGRFGTAHGWSNNMRHDLFINQAARSAVNNQEMEIYSADAWRPYLHCKDFALYLANSVNKFEVGLFNVVSENLTKRQILDSSILREKLKVNYSEKPDPRNYRVQTLEAITATSTLFETSLRGMIEKYAFGQA